MMTDDATWWVNGKPDLFPDAGTRTKAQMADAWPRMLDLLDDALELIPQTLVEEGDRVVAQVRSRALTKRGKRYQNGFLFLFTLRDSKVAAVREYTDLIHAASVFG
jgi:ketosteroid isomerase-like protein